MRCSLELTPVRASPECRAEQVPQLLWREPVSSRSRRARGLESRPPTTTPGGWRRRSSRRVTASSSRRSRSLWRPPAASLGAPYEWGGLTGVEHRLFRPRPHGLSVDGPIDPRDAWQQSPRPSSWDGTSPGWVTWSPTARGSAQHMLHFGLEWAESSIPPGVKGSASWRRKSPKSWP